MLMFPFLHIHCLNEVTFQMLGLHVHVAPFAPLTDAWYLSTVWIFHNMTIVNKDAHIIHHHMDPA